MFNKVIRSGRNCHRYIRFSGGQCSMWTVFKEDFIPALASLLSGCGASALNTIKRGLVLGLFLGLLTVLSRQSAHALPEGWTVISGDIEFKTVQNGLNITSKTNQAIVEYEKFNIGQNETVNFFLPNVQSNILNRVVGGQASQIAGSLNANGQILLINPAGVHIQSTSRVNVGSFLASSLNLSNANYLSQQWQFQSDSMVLGIVRNDGVIETSTGGLVALLGKQVENNGAIVSPEGDVHLAVGDQVRVALGEGVVLDVVVDEALQTEIQSAKATIENNGFIAAETVALEAKLKQALYSQVVNNTGIIQAASMLEEGGAIRLTASSKDETAVTNNSGVLIANGTNGGKILLEGDTAINSGLITALGSERGQGGEVDILGKQIILDGNGMVDASGGSGGGQIHIGGGYQGQGDKRTADLVFISPGTQLFADAINDGDGGKVIAWADKNTYFYGNIYARGGQQSGDGGFVETSGKIYLDAKGYVDLTAPNGNKGQYLLDPVNITIYGNVDPTFTSTNPGIDLASDLNLWLDAADASNITEVGGVVSQWNDKSVNGVHVQSTVGGEPITGSRNINGVNALYFDGGDRLINSTDAVTLFDTNSDIYVYFTAIQDTATVDIILYGKNGPNGLQGGSSYNGFGGGGSLFEPHAGLNAGGQINTFLDDGNTANSTSTGSVIQGNPFIGFSLFELSNGNVRVENGLNGNPDGSNTGGGTSNRTATDFIIGGHGASASNLDRLFDGALGEAIIFHDMSTIEQQLMEQYQSAKWNIALNPPGTGATEVDQATASDGYSVFAIDYLERLSQSADVSLLADNTIDLDFQGDTLNLANDRSISLNTTNGHITASSAGSIITNQTAAGGNIVINAGGAGNIDISNLTLNAQNGGDITLTAGGGTLSTGNITGGDVVFNADNLTLNNPVNATGTVSIIPNTTNASIGLGGSAGVVTLTNALIANITANTLQIGSNATTGDILLNNLDISGQSMNLALNTTGAISDDSVADDTNANIILGAGQNIIFDGGGGAGAGQVGLPGLADLDIIVSGSGSISVNTASPPSYINIAPPSGNPLINSDGSFTDSGFDPKVALRQIDHSVNQSHVDHSGINLPGPQPLIGPPLPSSKIIPVAQQVDFNSGENYRPAILAYGNGSIDFENKDIGEFRYSLNSDANSLTISDAHTNRKLNSLSVGKAPHSMVMNRPGKLLYVSNSEGNTVSVVFTGSNTVIATIPVGIDPRGLAINNDGSKVYVANFKSNTISVIDAKNNQVLEEISVGNNPANVEIAPDGSLLLVSNYKDNTVSVVGTKTNQVLNTIRVGQGPKSVAISKDSQRGFVANNLDNTISVIDLNNGEVQSTLSLINRLEGLYIQNKKLYIAFQDSNVNVLDVNSLYELDNFNLLDSNSKNILPAVEYNNGSYY